jgi:folate-dependent phosphoribosylglycinamide formyltransferase PurN
MRTRPAQRTLRGDTPLRNRIGSAALRNRHPDASTTGKRWYSTRTVTARAVRPIGRQRCDEQMVALVENRRIDLVVLAATCARQGLGHSSGSRARIIKTHPAPLPRFGGKGIFGNHVHHAVLESGVTASAAAVHLVAPEYDTGQVIAERPVPVHPDDDVTSLRDRVQRIERDLLIETVPKFGSSPTCHVGE